MTTNFQLLMLSPNLLRSQIAYMVVGGQGGREGGVQDEQLPTFDAESKSAEIPNSLYGGGVFMTANFQPLMLSPNLLRSQIPYTLGGGGWGGFMTTNFQLLMLSPNLLRSQIPYNGGGGGGRGWFHDGQLPTFDAESKSAKIPNCLYGWEFMTTNFQLLMLNPNRLRSQIPYTLAGGGGGC